MTKNVYIVDAFAARPFAGNPAGVVTDAAGLLTEQMQAIARELGQTETCFVLEPDLPDVDFQLRWFTPTVEVDLCGHATVAAYVCLFEEGRLTLDDQPARFRHLTRSGVLDVWVARGESSRPIVTMSTGVASIDPAADDRRAVVAAIGLSPESLDSELPLAREDASARLIVPIRRLHDLLALRPATSEMVRYGLGTGYRRFTLLCRETLDPSTLVHVRHFAPANGIPEDPVTGTAHAAIAVYLDQQGVLPVTERFRFVGEQGHAVNRPGTVVVEVVRDGRAIADVRIGGTGFIVARGIVEVP